MDQELVLRILDGILLSGKRKIKKSTLAQFFSGFNLDDLLKKANDRYKNFGFFIYQDKDYVELINRPEIARYLINFFGFEENEILQDILEVLAIVAYGGPISLKELDRLRGKKSSVILKELLSGGFIKKEKNTYRITQKFLKILGFNKVEDLPDYQSLRRELKGEK